MSNEAFVTYTLEYLKHVLGIPYDVEDGEVVNGDLVLTVTGDNIPAIKNGENQGVIATNNVYDRDYLLAKIETQLNKQ